MNYTAKFGSGGSDTFSSAGINIDSLAHHGGGDAVTIPDAHLLFSGDYSRSGSDLIVSDQLHRVVVPNYFQGDKRPALVSPDGAPLDPRIVEALTGHVEYAQAAGNVAAAAKVVGHVVKMTGSASVVRNGVTVTLNGGDNVYQTDVVQTGSGSTLGLVMIDGTTFNLSAGARLMLNDLTYDANSTSNSSLFTLVQGAASFVAGQVAKTGDMKVGTPVATMGIRGTAVILDISAVDGKVSISVVDQRDGQVHAVQVFNAQGILIGTVTSNGSTLTLTPVANFEVIAQESNKTPAQVALEFGFFQTLLQTYDVGRQLFPSLPEHTDNANPQTPTRYAQSSTPATPVDTPVTHFNTPTGNTPAGATGTPVVVVVNSSDPVPTGTPTPSSDPVTFHVELPANPLPFVVTASTVSRISGDGGDHFGPVMSADGQSIVYDPDGSIFLYDRHTNHTITVAQAGNGFTYSGQTISADGHFIVFQGTNGSQSWVFIYNNDPSDSAHYGHTTQLVAGGAPAISGDGSTIVVEQGGNSIGIYDQQGHVLATVTPAAIGHAGALWSPAISADGHVIAFWNNGGPSPGGSGHLFTYDLPTGTVREIASTTADAGNRAASFSADGHFVVYQAAPGGHSEIYLYDLSTGQVVFHTANASGESYNPVISPDGHFIIFASDAQLTADDTNAVADTYVVDVSDLNNPVYRLVSSLGTGTQPDAASNLGAAISAGGLFVAFGSRASNLSQGDTPGTGDIFLADSTSGRSAIIEERSDSPATLTAGGVIELTGDHNGVTLGVSDPSGRFTASFDAHGNIQWNFSEPRSDFAALLPGQISIQNFTITLNNGSGTTTIPVRVSVYDADHPVISVVANPGTIAGDNGDNTLTGTVHNDILQGFGGDDTLIGLAGVDRAVYTDATGGITVDLKAGTVTGPGVGADTLIGIEAIQGSNFADHYSAAGYTGSSGVPGVPVGFNSFEGMAGDDIITGNVNVQGQALTRISYASATAAVTVDLGSGIATGDASVGSDHFTNVSSVIGSGFGDTLSGSNNANGSFEQFDGRGGNDLIDGRGGYDMAVYASDPATHSGITANLAAGSVTGDASVGTDTLRSVEAIRGTQFADVYNAVGFGGGSTNAGSFGTFNNFDGQGGDDVIYGNGNTRIQYSQSTAAVLVDLADTGTGGTGVAMDLADAVNHTHFDLASVGVDTIHGGVNAVMGSMFGDTLLGSGNDDTFMGLAGNDTIDGRGGFDTAQYNNMTFTTGGIRVDMARGTVTGDASTGTDTLRSIEAIQGTNFADRYDATNFGAAGYLDGSQFNVGNFGTYNQFEGLGGDDTITGNGTTAIVYSNASAGVTVDLNAGTAHGTAPGDLANVGQDTITGGVNVVVGSNFADVYNAAGFAGGSYNSFQGLGGDDTITGNGYTQVFYVSATAGVTVDLVAGTADGNASVGHDTLTGVNSVTGSNFGDFLYGDSGSNSLFGQGGNDLLDGRGGNGDFLVGGTGADTFVYSTGYGATTVGDFHLSDGDQIDLRGLAGVHSLADVLAHATSSGPGGINTFIDFGGGNSLTLDSVSLASLVADDFVFSPAPTNLVINGDFETGNFSGWTQSGNMGFTSVSSSGSHGGLYSASLGPVGSDGYLTQTVSTVAGRHYTLDFWLSNDGGSPSDFSVSWNGATLLSSANAEPQAYTEYTFDVVGTGAASALQFEFRQDPRYWHLDDVSVSLASARPTIAGDMSIVAVTGGGEVALTTADLSAVDPGIDPGNLTFTVEHLNHGRLTLGDGRVQLNEGDTFTLADIQARHVYYQSAGTYVGQDHISLSLSDHVAGVSPVPVVLDATIVNAQFTVLTAGGYNFDQDDPIGAMGRGHLVPDGHSFRIINGAENRDFIVTGNDLAYDPDGHRFTAGTITSIQEVTHDESHTPLATFAMHVSAADWYNAVVAQSQGDQRPIEALVSQWTFNFVGNSGADAFFAGDVNDIFTGRGGNDTLGGEFGFDRANYGGATGPIDVQLADGIVTGTGASESGVGTDTLQSIEMVTGSNFADTFNAGPTASNPDGFNSSSTNAGSTVTNNVAGMFNEFEGRGGDDTITGNGQTRVSYYHATSGVTVTFDSHSWDPHYNPVGGASGTATGDASVGTDHFTGVNQVRGSFFNDVFHGSNNPGQTSENFEGLGGNDYIDGGGGFDRAQYFQAADDTGIVVHLADGIVTGGIDTGTDTLRSIEAIWGTNFADTYDATGFSGSSTNAGNAGNNGAASDFNEFEGGGGNDTVIGNGNTRVAFYHATGGVVVTLGENADAHAPTGHGSAVGASTGIDDLVSGVTRVRGSEFNDIITGNSADNNLEGQGGNDVLDGRGGNDVLTGGAGADIFVYDGAGNDRITDFSRADGDRIDLRAFSSIHAPGDLVISHGVVNGVANSTIITFAGGATLGLQGYDSVAHPLQASDFIFAGQVAVSVQTPDGYDFSTLYDDMAASNPVQAANDDTHIFAVNATRGITYELIGSGFTQPGGGTITEIDILNTTDPTRTTQDHVLVNTNGWSISASAFSSDIGQYASSDPSTHAAGLAALNGIFNAATYNAVGTPGFADNHSHPHDGADVFFGGDHPDIFNGLPGPFGSMDPGSDTVDYSHATAVDAQAHLGITVDLLHPENNTGAAAGDTFISIENLRGTDFNDTLTGDGQNNVIEGGLGDDVLNGGANGFGADTVSYEHATGYVTVDLHNSASQDTHSAGWDTLSNFEGVRGSAYNDILTGGGNTVLEGGGGDDTLIGQVGGTDTASYQHAAAGVVVDLAAGTARGGDGNDTLTHIANVFGSQFDDVITGDAGNNILFGNGGNDTFVFNDTAPGSVGHDTIGDFMSGQDHIQLNYAAFNPADASSFANWLTSHVTTDNNGSDLIIDLNRDGAHQGMDTIRLQNASFAGLHANDFILHGS